MRTMRWRTRAAIATAPPRCYGRRHLDRFAGKGVSITEITQLLARARSGELGVWLAAGEDVAALADDLALLQVIGLHFPKFTDGRSYSAATLLRTRYGYQGELRAIGQVLRDQFNYMTRCGFDALQPQAERYTDEQLESAIASIDDFTQPYQRSVQDPLPLFRRVERGNGSGVQR